MASWHDWIPRCTPADVDKGKAKGTHISDCCRSHECCGYYCDGYLGPLDTYMWGVPTMTVYVDDMFMPAKVGRINAKWCHMTADTTDELLALAASIGLKPQWIQHKGTWKEHFDVTEPKRQQAIASGAVEVGMLDSVRNMRTRWQARQPQENTALF